MQSNIKKLYDLFRKHPEISTDSRRISKNSLFFALKGDKFNGNIYAEDALNKGAAFAIIDEEKFKKDNRYILTNDVLTCLQALAQLHRQNLKFPIIAITGTNGKTTTKELIQQVLSKKFKTNATTGNLNNHIGVPLTLLSFSKNLDMGIVEMGANHIGEIALLCEIAKPNFGIITNIGKAHLEGFGSFEGVIKAKSELYLYIRNRGGKIFINADDKLLRETGKGIPQISYGNNNKWDTNGSIAKSFPFVGIDLIEKQRPIHIDSNLFGIYNVDNILAAICVGRFFGIEPIQLKNAIETYKPKNQRSQFLKTQKNQIIIDAYNANPTSMKAAIDSFRLSPMKNKVLILGDMLELGKTTLNEHQKIIKSIRNDFDSIFLVGEHFRLTAHDSGIPCFESTKALKQYLIAHPLNSKSILLKASRGIRIENILDIL